MNLDSYRGPVSAQMMKVMMECARKADDKSHENSKANMKTVMLMASEIGVASGLPDSPFDLYVKQLQKTDKKRAKAALETFKTADPTRKSARKILTIRIMLDGISPCVWRRLKVSLD